MIGPATNMLTVLDSFTDLWSPRLLAQVNDHDLKLAKIQGAYVWHRHPDSDELFLALEGEVDIHERTDDGAEQVTHLGPHDLYVVRKGVEHRPVSELGATVLLVEVAGTLSTGDFAEEIPDHITATTGIR